MGILNDAFNRRVEKNDKKDFASFQEFVYAFFVEAQQNATFIIPFHYVEDSKGELQHQPRFWRTNGGETALSMITDVEYMRYFDDQSYAGMKAINLLETIRDDAFVDGIVINSFSEYRCYLPKEDIIAMASGLGLL